MRRSNNQVRLVPARLAVSARLTDTAGNPSESYHWLHMATVLREWQHEFWYPDSNPLNLTRAERVAVEAMVRKELYP